MAKKKRNNRKKHNRNEEAHTDQEFLADIPEQNQEDWEGQAENSEDDSMNMRNGLENHEHYHEEPIVDPYSEQLEAREESQEEHSHYEEVSEEEHFSEQEGEQFEEDMGQQTASFTLGAFLRGEREKLGINLKSVSQSTKISLTNLEYLEADDIDSLPDRAYVTGYVKSYARLLGVETNFCLTLLDKTYQAKGALPKEQEIVIPQAQNSPTISDGFPMAKIAAIAAMVIVIVGIAGFFLTRDKTPSKQIGTNIESESVETKTVQEEPDTEEEVEITPQTLNAETPLQEELSEQVDETPTTADVAEEEVKVEAKPEPTSKPKKEEVVEVKKEEVAEVKKEEAKKEETTKEEKKKEERKFYPLTKNLYSFDDTMTSERINELLPDQFRVSPVQGIQAVYITATKGDSWLTYKSDDDPIKKFVLKEGRSLLFRAKEARVFLGNLGAVRIFLNNKPLKVSSRTGVKSLVFPQENAENYVMPLFIYKEDGTVQTSEDWIKENE